MRVIQVRGTRRVSGLLTVLVWSSCFVAIKGTEGDAPPLLYAAIRAAIGAIVLLALAAATRRLFPPRNSWPWLVALGLTNTTLGLAGMFLSVKLSGATIPAVLANSQALLVAPLAVWFFGDTLSLRRGLGLLVGIAGVALTTLSGSSSAAETWRLGVGLGLLAAFGLAAGNLLIKAVSNRIAPLTAVAWQYAIGAVGLFFWSAIAEVDADVKWTSRFIIGQLYLGVIVSAGASWMWYRLLKSGSLISLNGLTLLTPTLSVLLAWLLFRERISTESWGGILLTLVGVALVTFVPPPPGSESRDAR